MRCHPHTVSRWGAHQPPPADTGPDAQSQLCSRAGCAQGRTRIHPSLQDADRRQARVCAGGVCAQSQGLMPQSPPRLLLSVPSTALPRHHRPAQGLVFLTWVVCVK